MIRKSTRWDRKERVNVESDLSFKTTVNKHLLLTTDSRFNFGTIGFSYSFILEPINSGYVHQVAKGSVNIFMKFNVGATFEIYLNNATEAVNLNLNYPSLRNSKTLCTVTFDGITYKVFLNGALKNSLMSGSPNVPNFDISNTPYYLGNRSSLLDVFDGTISNLSWFNRALTQQEISYIHTQGGLIPESAHESCVAHYPLTQRQYFKASADFIIKHPQFALNDLIALDVVEQYNYSKPTGAIASFSDAGGGEVTATDVAHGLSTGQTVNIADTVNYNGTYVITVLTVDTFKFTAVWVATETGNWNQFLTANHGELINFTDAEAGTDGLAPIGTLIKDFYEKTALDVYNAPVQPLPINNIEKLTQMQPSVNSLDLNGGTVAIAGSGTGIGLFIKLEATALNLAAIVSGLSAITEYRVNGNLVANESALIDAVNNLELIHIHIKATITNPIIQAFNGHVGLAYISNDNITLKDIYKNVNNLLISNPSVSNQSKFNHYYLFNELINTNEIADKIGASNATTAATTFIDINELR